MPLPTAHLLNGLWGRVDAGAWPCRVRRLMAWTQSRLGGGCATAPNENKQKRAHGVHVWVCSYPPPWTVRLLRAETKTYVTRDHVCVWISVDKLFKKNVFMKQQM